MNCRTKTLASVVLVLFSTLVFNSAHADFRAAAETYKNQELERAFKEFEALAKLGHRESQYILGVMYLRGEGASKDLLQSYGWLKLAAQSGHQQASAALPKLRANLTEESVAAAERMVSEFEPGALNERLMPKVVPDRDYASMTAPKAKKLAPPDYSAATRRAGLSGSVLVELTIAPDGTVRDTRVLSAVPPNVFEDAVLRVTPTWRFEPAMQDNVPTTALHVVNVTFRITDPVMEQIEREMAELKRDAENEDVVAQYVYGMVLASHPILRKPWSETLPWITKAAQSGLPEAQFELAQSLLKGRGCERDLPKALRWLTLAAQQGDANAQVTLGRVAFTPGPGYEPDKGLRWMREAAAQKHPRGSKYLASVLAAAPSAEVRDPKEALELLKTVEKADRHEPTLHEIRAAALAHLGDFNAAVAAQTLALKRARKLDWDTSEMEARLRSYSTGQPWTGELLL